ncbi:MAG: dephospho-CoA kinase [Phycisphaerae bacterium]|jgi:dephospho-CoA kinase
MKSPTQTKPVIGILGGVGAGKSAAAAEFAKLGCRVIDADEIGHNVLAEEAVRREIVQAWGAEVLDSDGCVDRRKLGEIVFGKPAELARLNALMYPRIGQRIAGQIALAQADASVRAVVLDAAVLLEARWDSLCTHLVYIDADAARRQSRVSNRGWSGPRWKARENSQISLDTKRERCDYYVDNSSSVSHLGEQIREIFNKIVRITG